MEQPTGDIDEKGFAIHPAGQLYAYWDKDNYVYLTASFHGEVIPLVRFTTAEWRQWLKDEQDKVGTGEIPDYLSRDFKDDKKDG